MLRSFIFLLLLIVVFLSGIILGVDREKSTIEGNIQEAEDISEVNADILDMKEEHLVRIEQVNTDAPVHFVQKTASFLEGVVKGFYEIVVEVLYQLSTFFF